MDEKLTGVNVKDTTTAGKYTAEVDDKELKSIRLSHIKKEKSRDAARSRRGKENLEFYELAKLLPIPDDTSSQLDKASIIRLTLSYLQLRELTLKGDIIRSLSKADSESTRSIWNNEITSIMESLDGFLIVINKEGRCLYASNAVSTYLGLSQVDLLGNNMLNSIHPDDKDEMQKHLQHKCFEECNQKFCHVSAGGEGSRNCSLFVRMKSTLTRRGINVKSPGYKVVHISGCFVNKSADDTSKDEEDDGGDENKVLGFIGLVEVLPSPLLDVSLDMSMFVIRVDLAMKVTYTEERIKDLTGFESSEVTGKSLYQCIHPADGEKMRLCHQELLAKGQVKTPFYRWLLKNGSSLWLQSYVAILQEKHLGSDAGDEFAWISHLICKGKDSLSDCTSLPLKTEQEGLDVPSREPSSEPSTSAEDQRLVKTDISAVEEPEHNFPPAISQVDVETAEKILQCSSLLLQGAHDDSSPKLVKVNPMKAAKLKRTLSETPHSDRVETGDVFVNGMIKRERLEPLSNKMTPSNIQEKAVTDVLDVHSTMWGNPPNREVANQSDLHMTGLHHHYPYGLDPNLLNSNPLLAKMLTTNYVSYGSILTQADPFLLAPPTVNLYTPVLNAIPHLVPATPSKITYCPTSVTNILDELRKDPMRKVNPPNKVVLSCSRIPESDPVEGNNGSQENTAATVTTGSNTHSEELLTSLNPTLLALPGVSNNNILLAPVGGYGTHNANGAIIFHPVKIATSINDINFLS